MNATPGPHDLTADPQFNVLGTDPSSSDFHLLESSPAARSGNLAVAPPRRSGRPLAPAAAGHGQPRRLRIGDQRQRRFSRRGRGERGQLRGWRRGARRAGDDRSAGASEPTHCRWPAMEATDTCRWKWAPRACIRQRRGAHDLLVQPTGERRGAVWDIRDHPGAGGIRGPAQPPVTSSGEASAPGLLLCYAGGAGPGASLSWMEPWLQVVGRPPGSYLTTSTGEWLHRRSLARGFLPLAPVFPTRVAP